MAVVKTKTWMNRDRIPGLLMWHKIGRNKNWEGQRLMKERDRKHLVNLGVQNWEEKALGRKNCKKIVNEAMVLQGPLC